MRREIMCGFINRREVKPKVEFKICIKFANLTFRVLENDKKHRQKNNTENRYAKASAENCRA
jgi:hypothetical protein